MKEIIKANFALFLLLVIILICAICANKDLAVLAICSIPFIIILYCNIRVYKREYEKYTNFFIGEIVAFLLPCFISWDAGGVIVGIILVTFMSVGMCSDEEDF